MLEDSYCVSLSIVSSRAWTCPLLTGLSYIQTFYQFSCFPLNSLQFVFLFKHMISKTEHKPQVGLDGATQSNKSGFSLFAFLLKSRCIKVFAFIGNRLFLILLSLLPTICNIRVFGTIKLPLVLMWIDYSFVELFYISFQEIFPTIKVIL